MTYTTVQLIESNLIDLNDQDVRSEFAAFLTEEENALWEYVDGNWEVAGFEDYECSSGCCSFPEDSTIEVW